MKIISFTWTTPALLAGAKTVTRRQWKPEYAGRFKAGDFILAYDKSPRAGGRPVVLIRLVKAPYYESLAQMPDSDFQAEGFGWFMRESSEAVCREALKAIDYFYGVQATRAWCFETFFEKWKESGDSIWVVRFALVTCLDHLPREHAGYIAGEIERAAQAGEAACVFCGCRDSSVCINRCSWLAVDHRRAVGVCSNHPTLLSTLRLPDRGWPAWGGGPPGAGAQGDPRGLES